MKKKQGTKVYIKYALKYAKKKNQNHKGIMWKN